MTPVTSRSYTRTDNCNFSIMTSPYKLLSRVLNNLEGIYTDVRGQLWQYTTSHHKLLLCQNIQHICIYMYFAPGTYYVTDYVSLHQPTWGPICPFSPGAASRQTGPEKQVYPVRQTTRVTSRLIQYTAYQYSVEAENTIHIDEGHFPENKQKSETMLNNAVSSRLKIDC